MHFTGKVITVEGIITDLIQTNSSENDTYVFENHYSFTTVEEYEFESFSYSTGQEMQIGQTVRIEYPEGEPQYSRIQGMRGHKFGPGASLVVIFPLVALYALFGGIRKSMRAIRLFKKGVQAV